MDKIDLIIGDYAYRLPVGVDEGAVLEQLTDAVRDGGGIVELPRGAVHASLAVLISPGVPVFIERTPMPDDAAEEPADETDSGQSDWFDV